MYCMGVKNRDNVRRHLHYHILDGFLNASEVIVKILTITTKIMHVHQIINESTLEIEIIILFFFSNYVYTLSRDML